MKRFALGWIGGMNFVMFFYDLDNGKVESGLISLFIAAVMLVGSWALWTGEHDRELKRK